MIQNFPDPDNLPDHQDDNSTAGSRVGSDPENQETESKSQRKRNAHQTTQLAGLLVEMKPKALAALPLEPDVREAISHCAEIKAHGARKRQLHFVSKLLRESGNTRELQALLKRPGLTGKTRQDSSPHLEFRNQLIDNFADHVESLREQYPGADLQQVRQLVRNAHSESSKALKKKSEQSADAEEPAPTLSAHDTKSARSLLKLLSASHK